MSLKFLLTILFTFSTFLVHPQTVFAGDPPQLSSPSDGSTTSSSKLEWQVPSYALYSGNSYRVQVDDDSSFSSLNKDYYTDNTHYTPTLSDGLWYWRVKAKDAGGVWSDWSSVWSFTLTSNSPNPSPSPTSDPSSDPAPTPIPTPTPQPTPQPTSSSQSSSFLISGVPSQINSDQSVNVIVNLSLPNNPNTKFYLKGAFKKSDGSNYFGQTLVSGSWVKNGSSFSSQFPITTDGSGNWSGNLEVMVDSEDSGFTGSGDYIFKVGRYTSSGSGPTWSNEITIKIVNVESGVQKVQGSTPIQTKTTNSPSPSAYKLTSTNTKNSSVLSANSSSFNQGQNNHSSPSATINPSPQVVADVLEDKKFNFIPWIGLGLVVCGISSLGFVYFKKRKSI